MDSGTYAERLRASGLGSLHVPCIALNPVVEWLARSAYSSASHPYKRGLGLGFRVQDQSHRCPAAACWHVLWV